MSQAIVSAERAMSTRRGAERKDEGGRMKDEPDSRPSAALVGSSFILHPSSFVPHPFSSLRQHSALLLGRDEAGEVGVVAQKLLQFGQ
jgi:hypothetical protein